MSGLTPVESEQTDSTQTLVGPGVRLRKERQAQGLDQSRAAAQLHLSDAMIEALETDDFDALPGAVFAQGYLRNYARLLGVPEDEVMGAYHRMQPQFEQQGLAAREPGSVIREVRSSHRIMRLATLLIVVGLLALLLLWWQDRLQLESESLGEAQDAQPAVPTAYLPEDDTEETELAAPLTDNTPDSAPIAEASKPQSVQDLATSVPPATPPEPQSVVASVEPPLESAPEEPPSPLLPAATAEQSESSEPAAGPMPDEVRVRSQQQTVPETQEAIVETATQSADVEAPQQVGQTSVSPTELVFEFYGTCWAEVRDATGKAEIIGEMKDGDRRTLVSDLGPFKIVLGNIKFVTLTVNGKPFNLANHSRGVIARFTLDPSQL
jgi:cytoskeleton protein RodZ